MNIENKYVFSFFLNKGSVSTFLTWLGRPFHNFGAQTENALSPYVFLLSVRFCSANVRYTVSNPLQRQVLRISSCFKCVKTSRETTYFDFKRNS